MRNEAIVFHEFIQIERRIIHEKIRLFRSNSTSVLGNLVEYYTERNRLERELMDIALHKQEEKR